MSRRGGRRAPGRRAVAPGDRARPALPLTFEGVGSLAKVEGGLLKVPLHEKRLQKKAEKEVTALLGGHAASSGLPAPAPQPWWLPARADPRQALFNRNVPKPGGA